MPFHTSWILKYRLAVSARSLMQCMIFTADMALKQNAAKDCAITAAVLSDGASLMKKWLSRLRKSLT